MKILGIYAKNSESGEWETGTPKYDFSATRAWFEKQPEPIGPEDLYIVEEISTFKNAYLVRAGSKDEAEDFVAADYSDTSAFQKHLGASVVSVRKVRSDADVVEMLQQTEQPSMTLELFTAKRELWYRNNINE